MLLFEMSWAKWNSRHQDKMKKALDEESGNLGVNS